MNTRYECIRSAKRRLTFVIHRAGEDGFYAMPEEIRNLGPWTDIRRGEIAMLKPEYRLQLARDGYVLLEGVGWDWKPEV